MRLTSISLAATILIAAGIFTFWPGGNAGPGRAAAVAQNPTRPAPGGAGLGGLLGGGVPPVPSLDDKLKQRMDALFTETPLQDVVEFLADRNDIQFIVKRNKLADAGINTDTPITHNLKNVRLSTFLDVMLEELGLVYTEKDDLIVITTPDDALATMEVRVYDCRDLLTMPTVGQARPGMMMPGGGYPGGPGPIRGYGGAPVIEGPGIPGPGGPHDPPSLDQPGGPPVSSPVPRGGLPRAFPGSDGGVPGPGPGEGGSAPSLPGAGVPVPETPRRPNRDVLPQLVGEGGQGLGGISAGPGGPMGGALGGGMGGRLGSQQRPMSAEELKAEQLMNIITTAVDPNSWADVGGTGTIGEYNGLIVISQSARTHTKIEKVLDMLREAANLPKSPTSRVVR